MSDQEAEVDITTPDAAPTQMVGHILSNAAYDKLRILVEIFMPGFATLYFTLAQIWSWSNASEVVGTMAAVTIFLGLFIKVADRSYNMSDDKFDGEMAVLKSDDGVTTYSLEAFGDVADLANRDEIKFRVR